MWAVRRTDTFPQNDFFQEEACSQAAGGGQSTQNFNISLESYSFDYGNQFLLITCDLGLEMLVCYQIM